MFELHAMSACQPGSFMPSKRCRIWALWVGFALLMGSNAHAAAPAQDGSYFNEKERGWFWYEPIPEPASPSGSVPLPGAPSEVAQDPQALLKAYQKRLEDAKALAVMEPTPANVQHYMEMQYETMERAGVFADTWRRVVWSNPQLDTTLRYPVSSVGVQTQRKVKRMDRDQAIDMIARTDGLFFFFKQSCPYCRTQAPIVRTFAAKHGVSVMPISMDGGGMAEFPDAVADNGWAAELGVTVTPALYMVNPRSKDIVPLGFGVLTEEDIADRIHVIALRRMGEF